MCSIVYLFVGVLVTMYDHGRNGVIEMIGYNVPWLGLLLLFMSWLLWPIVLILMFIERMREKCKDN